MIGMSIWCGCGLGEVGGICGPFVTAPSLPAHSLFAIAGVCVGFCYSLDLCACVLTDRWFRML